MKILKVMIKNTAYWQVRDEKGRIFTQRKIKGSGLNTKEAAEQIFKLNKSLFPRLRITTFKGKNVTERSVVPLDNKLKAKDLRKPKGKQIVASVRLDGQTIKSSASKIGTKEVRNFREAKEMALENLAKAVSYIFSGETDVAEGLRLIRGNTIRFSYKYYVKN